jgi:hypothetical protein
MSTFKDSATKVLKKLDERNGESKRVKQEEYIDLTDLEFPLAGKNGRLDLQLQPNLIDNEYLSAVLAHSSYFGNTDVVDYIIDKTGGWRNDLISAIHDAPRSKPSPAK